MALSTQPYKGARDFYPEDKRFQKYLFAKLREVVERFGYEEYDAPILEPTELYLIKGNQEIIDEQTYTFKDRSDRSVTIRTEMTPSVSRMVAARRQELAYPLRWYSIPNLWRYERPQRGRLREFWQLNVDLFGIEEQWAEIEMIQIIDAIMKAVGGKPDMYTIRLNDRAFMDYVLREYLRFDEVQAASVARQIDRLHKTDRADFIARVDALCNSVQRENNTVDKLLEILSVGETDSLPEPLRAHNSIRAINDTISALKRAGISNVSFDATLMRGFDYYTGIVFEVFDNHPDNNRSMFGGGRYDGMVGLFGAEPVPTVGFGMGDVALANFIELHGLTPSLPTETNAYVVVIGAEHDRVRPGVDELRGMGLNLAVDFSGRKPDKQIRTAVKKGIPYVIIIGDDELTSGRYTLRNLHTGVEEKHSPERIVSILRDYRHHNETGQL